jgi:signal transduction histidine kinase
VHIKICVYRFVQEGLNNAYRHAPGSRQTVECDVADGVLSLKVENGPYVMSNALPAHPSGQLGLEGLRGRVEALCGQFDFRTSPESGSKLEMSVRLDEVAAA